MYLRPVSSHLKAVQIQFAESAENTEYLWIYFVVANLPVYLCCCYNPPKPNYSSAALVEILCESNFVNRFPFGYNSCW